MPDQLLNWAGMPHFLVAVLVPLVAWSTTLVLSALQGKFPPGLCKWWLVGLLGTFVSGRWAVSQEQVALYLVCTFGLLSLFLVHRKRVVAPLVAGALTFFDLFLNDVLHATTAAWAGVLPQSDFLTGVGGAGLRDGLVVFPVLIAGVVAYGNWRLRDTPRLPL